MPAIRQRRKTVKKKASKKAWRGAKKGKKGIPVPSDSIRSRMINLDDLPDDGVKMCIYGRSATGKTRLLGTFAERGKLLHIVCSSNKMNEARSIKGTKNVTVVDLRHPDELLELIEIAKEEEYTTVGLDHVTEFNDMVLADVIGLEAIPEQLSWGLAKQQEYGQASLRTKTYLRQLLDLDCNVILNGNERVYKATEEDDSIIMPYVSLAATPSVTGWIVRSCDYVAQTFIRPKYKEVKRKVGKKTITKRERTNEKEFCLRVGPSDVFTTKFRVSVGVKLPEVIINPVASDIFDLIG